MLDDTAPRAYPHTITPQDGSAAPIAVRANRRGVSGARRSGLVRTALLAAALVLTTACADDSLTSGQQLSSNEEVSANVAGTRKWWRRPRIRPLPVPPSTPAPDTTTTPPVVTPPAPTPPAPTPPPPAPPAPTPPPPAPPAPPATTGTWQRIDPPVNLGLHGRDQFGFQTIALSPANPNILYLGTCYEGIWKSNDRGTTWFRVSTGANGPNLSTGRNWSVSVDPSNANIVYTVAGYGSNQGIWKSTNGGVDWTQLMSQSVLNATAGSVYNVAINPTDGRHLLVGFHQGWAGTENSGVMESRDGGATWILHQPQGFWGKGNYALFINTTTWLLATQEQGFWRTANSGATWTRVVAPNVANMPHGAGSVYRSANGTVYTASSIGILRSTDNGASWNRVGPSNTPDGYMSVIGDGTRLYTQRANTGNAISGPLPYYTSLESDGVNWVPYNNQTFTNGPGSMAFDPTNRIMYSSNWMAGVWKLTLAP